ncbi:hypothetical protein [Gephyromycinifex aptenodytis]|uniref:hypothetical protein n=1 Tax=Gephyromycinifex aptenodytis TaxID=2716227 RepID=UPI001447070B|nr:hypothetical protein [Gephyromycinifex aptenodytis]
MSYGLARVSGSSPQAREIAALAHSCAQQVQQVWPEPWSGNIHIEAPATDTEYRRLTGAPPGQHSGIAATTLADVHPDGRASNIRVVLDPEVWAELTAQGRRVILTHETVHVALLQHPRGPLPTWFVEGMAEYLAYLDSGLEVAEVAAPLLQRVARDGPPDRLPTDAQFTGDDRAEVYAQAWIACQVAVRLAGQEAVLRSLIGPAAQRQGQNGTSQPLPLSTRRLTNAWRAELQRLAPDSGAGA